MCLHLNAEFQRITKSDKKAFLSDKCKEMEEKRKKKKRKTLQNCQSPRYRWRFITIIKKCD